jgi:hypothetical protein
LLTLQSACAYSEKSKGRLPGTREEDARVGSSGGAGS